MHQDEAGRWVSDNGRYLWSGSEWIDLEDGPSAADADLPDHDYADAHEPPDDDGDAHEPGRDPYPSELSDRHEYDHEHDAGPPTTPSPPDQAPRRRGPLVLLGLLGLLVLVAAGVIAVLVVGHRSGSKPTSAAPTPSTASTPGTQPSPAPSSQVLDESQRRDRAQRALVTAKDFPESTEDKQVNPTDVFLPCRAAALTPQPGTILVGRTVSNSDYSVYIGQTIAGYPTVRDASEALDQVRTALQQQCSPYDYHYANSPRIDRISHQDVDSPLDVADGGVYLEEIDTPSNYTGTTTIYSYGYVRRGQFLVRVTLTNHSKADRQGLERLLQNVTSNLG